MKKEDARSTDLSNKSVVIILALFIVVSIILLGVSLHALGEAELTIQAGSKTASLNVITPPVEQEPMNADGKVSLNVIKQV